MYDSLALQMVAKNETQDKKLQEFSIVLIAALSENVIYKNWAKKAKEGRGRIFRKVLKCHSGSYR